MGKAKPERETDERLRRDEERFSLLVASVRDYAIFLLEPDGTVASWNEGARRIKGYTAEEIVGRHFSTFYRPEDRARTAHELEVAAKTGRYEEEGWRVRKDGSVFWANVIITALREKSGELVGFAKVTRDLTERRAAEERLRETVTALAKSNAELDEYASFVSHDLQEPLRKMASYAELLKARYGDKLDEKGNSYIGFVVDGAVRMRGLITDVLDYSRIGRSEPPFTEVDLKTLAEQTVRDLEFAISDKGGRVELGELPTVRGNHLRLARLFQNLIGNALKFRDDSRPPVVRVRSERRGADWVISFADNGIGFEPAEFARIVRPFHRLHAKERYPGSGLGLAAVKKITDLHGGRFWAESRPGLGSTFFVSIPAS